MNFGWLKEHFWYYVTIHDLDKYRIKLILKFKNFIRIAILQAGFLSIQFFFSAYIFTIIFSKPKDNLISARTD